MVQLPRKLAEGQSQRLRSKLRCYNYKGKKSVGGDVTRTIKRLPNESATAGGQAFDDCAHLELRTRYNINLLGWIEAREEVWLARDVGEVRRTQNWDGLILLKRVREAWDMELIERRGQAESTSAQYDAGNSSNALEAWSACAAYVEPALPTPYLHGVVADLLPASINTIKNKRGEWRPRHPPQSR
jgi:hypothetical protein